MRLVLPEFAGASMIPGHQPVLLREVLGFLAPADGGRYLDSTFGGGGHSRAILESARDVHLVAIDRDPEAAPRAEALAAEFPGRFKLIDRDFGRLGGVADSDFDGILFDFGLSSFQLDDPGRGFSFRADGHADMRLDPRAGVPAARWLEMTGLILVALLPFAAFAILARKRTGDASFAPFLPQGEPESSSEPRRSPTSSRARYRHATGEPPGSTRQPVHFRESELRSTMRLARSSARCLPLSTSSGRRACCARSAFTRWRIAP